MQAINVILKNEKIKIYLDTADINKIVKVDKDKRISGYTTNPSLMKKIILKVIVNLLNTFKQNFKTNKF